MDDWLNNSFIRLLSGGNYASNKISAAGRMLDAMDRANEQAAQVPVTEELQAALRRADILSRREAA